jgi:hypothetical protein
MPLSPGSKLGPYEILAPIGADGTGDVYKARATRGLDRVVTINVFKTEFSERFEREARAVTLNHSNIWLAESKFRRLKGYRETC